MDIAPIPLPAAPRPHADQTPDPHAACPAHPGAGRAPSHIRDWPAAERPREKLLARGAPVLSDAELLAIFLGSGLRGLDAVATARNLLALHGPLRCLLERPPAELADLPGLGPARACQLSAALELCNRYLAAGLERGEALTDPQSAGRYFTQRLRGHPNEVFAALFLDSRHRALAFEELFRGTVDGAEVHPREVVRRALAYNAAAVIVGHNHPSGNAEPSAADRAVTARLKQALALVDVRLLDHFVVGDGAPMSLAARGWV
ncbi:RadC family protein [Luteimonas vadosa]|uniref:DNA repair protein RadC n=1 Tax=Luteimonas vadosa TaxID=1165507 RepID=A0ABP9DVG2_9GAMM